MIIKELPIEFKEAIPVIEAIEAAGFEAYFVGGSVRDVMLDKKIHDVDIATSAFPEEIKQIFPKTIDVGIEHGTVLVLFGHEQYEITTFRTESAYQDFRRPDKVTFVRSLEEDLKRRDFTMNALAMKRDGQVIDLFDGIEAIRDRRIIAVGDPSERFHEDALRMLRGLRFSSQLNFEIETNTLMAISEHSKLLSKISIERICVEWVKLLLSEHRNKGLKSFIDTNCYSYCPGLKDKREALENFLKLDENKRLERESIAWLVLCYCLEIKNAHSFLKQWKCSNKLINQVVTSLYQLRLRDETDWSTMDVYHSGEDIIKDVESARSVLEKASDVDQILIRYELLPIKSKADLKITGKDILEVLNTPTGPWMGELLNELEKQVVLENIQNEPMILLEKAKQWKGEK